MAFYFLPIYLLLHFQNIQLSFLESIGSNEFEIMINSQYTFEQLKPKVSIPIDISSDTLTYFSYGIYYHLLLKDVEVNYSVMPQPDYDQNIQYHLKIYPPKDPNEDISILNELEINP